MTKYQSLTTACQSAVQQALWEGLRASFRRQDLCWIISEDVANDLMKEMEFDGSRFVKDPAYADKENSLFGIPAYISKTPGTLKLCAVMSTIPVTKL